jgi:DNA topoisomerase VI subunit B
VNIKFNKDSQLDLLEYTEELRISPQDYLKKVMVTGGYQEIVIKTQNGNVVVCERTIKQKFK